MEKVIMYMLFLLPGFLAMKTAIYLGKNINHEKTTDMILSYIAFGTFSNLLILLLSMIIGIVPYNDAIGSPFITSPPAWIVFAYGVVSIIVSIATGYVWAVWISKPILRIANRISWKNGSNMHYNGRLLDNMFDDGEDHFLIVQKDGEDVGVGFYMSVDNETRAIELCEYPAYRAELVKARKGKQSPLANRKRTYVDASAGLVIYETDYPKEWTRREQA